jgi:hypothetical protein
VEDVVVVQVNGLGRKVERICYPVPRSSLWYELQPAQAGKLKAIVVDFGEVETGFVLETGGSVASQSQQTSLLSL